VETKIKSAAQYCNVVKKKKLRRGHNAIELLNREETKMQGMQTEIVLTKRSSNRRPSLGGFHTGGLKRSNRIEQGENTFLSKSKKDKKSSDVSLE